MRTRYRSGLFFLALFVVVAGSLWPRAPLATASHIIDKFEHALAYAGLTVLALWAGGRMRWVVGLLFVLGLSVELGQWAMAQGREGSWADLLANTVGLIIGLLLYRIWSRLHVH